MFTDRTVRHTRIKSAQPDPCFETSYSRVLIAKFARFFGENRTRSRQSSPVHHLKHGLASRHARTFLACWMFLTWDLDMTQTPADLPSAGPDEIDQALLFEVIENQLSDEYPKEVTATLLRLRMTGHSREDAIELIACALAPEMVDVIEFNKAFNLERYEARLRQLPDIDWIDA